MGRKNRRNKNRSKQNKRNKNKNYYSDSSGELVQLPNATNKARKFRTRGPQAINDLAIQHFGSRYYCVGERKRIEQESNINDRGSSVAEEPDGPVDGKV